jgi:glycogen debranching enzyme
MSIQQKIKQAQYIAKNSIFACHSNQGLLAGSHHFVDLWARDSFFATYGLIQKKDFPIFRQTIDTFLQFQRKDGLIPYRVMRSKSNLSKYFGKPSLLEHPVANFYSHMSLGLVPDGGLMAIISSAEYVRRSGDIKWLQSQFQGLKRAISWYHNEFEDSLISNGFSVNGQMGF